MGIYNLSTVTTEDVYEVESIKKHPNYSSSPLFENDIALLKLKHSVALRKNIKTVRLPSKTEKYTDKEGIILGWGKSETTDLSISGPLKFVKTEIISDKECSNIYGKVRASLYCLF